MIRRPSRSTLTDSLFPYTTLFRSGEGAVFGQAGGRNMADDRLEQRFERAFARVGAVGGETAAARGVEDREVELLVIGFERQEQLERLVEHFGGARVAAVDLVADHDRLEASTDERRVGKESGDTCGSRG